MAAWNPIDLGARGTQIGNPDSDGPIILTSYNAATTTAVPFSTAPVRFRGYFATVAELPAEVVVESEFWKINPYCAFIAQKRTGTYAKSFSFTRLDVDARSIKGVIDVLIRSAATATSTTRMSQWRKAPARSGRTKTTPLPLRLAGDGYDWDEKRFAELRWTFDAAGALYICETQAKTEAALAALPVDDALLENGCNGEAWLTIEEPSRDLGFPEF